jgi:colanic acid/amylovoran biosynthesis glycosyltransferase
MTDGRIQDNARRNGRPIGYVLRMFPRYSQTFIVNELLALERLGIHLRIASLRRPSEDVVHASVRRLRSSIDYFPEPREARAKDGQIGEHRGAVSETGVDRIHGRLGAYDIPWEEHAQARLLIDWARRYRIGHVHVHFGTGEATVAWLAHRFGGPSYTLTLHAFDIFRDNVDRRLLAEKINGSRFTVTVCESNRRFILEHLPGVEAERIRVSYNGIDLERFTDSDRQRDPQLVLAVGRLIEKKGFIHLVHAIAMLRDQGLRLRCDIVGDGRERQRLQDEIRRLQLDAQVRLVGILEQEEVQQRMREASCLVAPCVEARDGNIDALPTVLLEALASGCPVISTKLSGIPEIIESGVSGLLIEPRDENALANAIEHLLRDQELAMRLGRSGRRRVEEKFDVHRNVAALHDWLRTATSPGTAPDETMACANDRRAGRVRKRAAMPDR